MSQSAVRILFRAVCIKGKIRTGINKYTAARFLIPGRLTEYMYIHWKTAGYYETAGSISGNRSLDNSFLQ